MFLDFDLRIIFWIEKGPLMEWSVMNIMTTNNPNIKLKRKRQRETFLYLSPPFHYFLFLFCFFFNNK